MTRAPVSLNMSLRLLLMALTLGGAAGCAGLGGTGDPAEDECRRQAYDDPAVKDALLRSNSNMQQVRGPALIEMNALVREDMRRCLARQGVGPSGGVEAVKPY